VRPRAQTNRIIWHHSLSPPDTAWDDVLGWHRARGFSTWGYHFGIGGDGFEYRGRAVELVGAHALGRNMDSIGVCLLGNFFKTEPTVAQLETAQALYHALCRFYGKRLECEFHRPDGVVGMSSGEAPCPGSKLDRADFLEIVYRGCPYED